MRPLFLSILCLCLAVGASAQDLAPDVLTKGGYVVYFRHGEADIGKDCRNPKIRAWWRSRDPEKTRQLTEYGRYQAGVIGESFRKLGLRVDRFLCSEFTRAEDTAREMHLGRLRRTRALTPLVYPGSLEKRMLGLLRESPKNGRVSVLVAHGHVAPDFEDLYEGDAAVFSPGPEPKLEGYIRYREWEKLVKPLHFASSKEKDRFLLDENSVRVLSSMGIGRVTITPRAKWPDELRVRFEYANGQGMKVLEGLQIRGAAGRLESPKPELVDGALEIVLGPPILGSNQAVMIHWVDFYR